MKILVDLTHPAHVHFFKSPIQQWIARGHRVIITSRDKDLTLSLLDHYGLPHTSLGSARSGLLGLGWELMDRGSRLWRVVRRERPTVVTAVGGTFIAPVGWLAGTPVVLFTDTEHARVANAIAFPFATVVCTPSAYKIDLGPRQVRYDGYHELAYLHPTQFTPDPQVLPKAGLAETDVYFIVRFVSWGAAHDVGHHGFTREGKYRLVAELQKLGRVIITSEAPLPPDLEHHRMPVSHAELHDLLAFSRLYIGEGGTLASEAVVLGVPAVFVNTLSMGYVEEQQNMYGMICLTSDENVGIAQALEWGSDPDIRQTWQVKRQKLLADKIDVSAWMVDFVEQFPHSDHARDAI
jgi:predicted glycosyltransferase